MGSIVGIVLAGGRSSRMGQDKALLPIGNSTFLARAVENLTPYCENVWVNGDYPAFDCIVDEPGKQAFRGPLAGIQSCLNQLLQSDAQGLIVVPVDMPWLSASPIQKLLQQAEHSPQQACYFSESLFPIYLPLSKTCQQTLEELMSAKQQKTHSIQALLTKLKANSLDYDKPEELININTPEQFQATQSQDG